MRVAVALALASSVGVAASARAQNPERLRASFSFGTQIGPRTVSQDFETTINQEAAAILNDIDVSGRRIVDVGAAYHLTGPLWAGVAVSSLARTTGSTLAAKVPHPFYFNQPRLVDGTVEDLESKETAVHISLSYLVPISAKLDVAIFGGPSRLSIAQDLVTDIDYDETYPFDTATLTSATSVRASGSAWGFNAGADVTWRLSKMFGVGGLIRFAKASTTLVASPGNEASIDAGGAVAGGGLRVIF